MEGSQKKASVLILLLFTASKTGQKTPASNKTEGQGQREAKFLSIFTVVKFPNTVCESATVGRNGTCYTLSECLGKSGTSSGSCASSFGVCCVFEASCGSGSVAENHTYFTSSSVNKGSNCNFKICKSNSNVCQMRLDFETFALNNPYTNAGTTSINGPGVGAGDYTLGGTCHVDTFGVSAPGYPSIPIICGTNTGEHMYVPASDRCNTLSANIGTTSTSTTGSFAIKITQIPCDSPVLPREGCLQYYYGSTSGTISSYNHQPDSDGAQQTGKSQLLVNQHYNACIRAERAVCSICYWPPKVDEGFFMSVPKGDAAIGLLGFDTNCGALGFGDNGAITGTGYANGGNYDFITIPSGICHPPATAEADTNPTDRYCGTSLNCQGPAGANAAVGAPDGTVCTSMKPFKLSVHSDGVEYAHPIAASENLAPNNSGFRLNYYMKTQCLWYQTALT